MSAGPMDLHWVQRPPTRIGKVYRPATVAEAAALLAQDTELRLVAGGTDLVLELARTGTGGHADLIDLTAVQAFAELDFEDPDVIRIGAGVTHAGILASSTAAELVLPLAQACLEIGSPQLRNRATIVGNLVTASPANDTISALLALDASVEFVRFVNGELITNSVGLDDFYTGFRATALQPSDVVTAVTVPRPGPRQRGIWVKAGLRKAQAISVVHAGFNLDFDTAGVVASARIALGSVAATVVLAEEAARVLVGEQLSEDVIARAAAIAAANVSPIDDGRATAEYRTASIVTVVTRALAALANGTERDRWPQRIPLLSVPVPTTSGEPSSDAEIKANVNGESTTGPTAGVGTLLDWLRENAGTGTKEGCAEGECGACTVQLDGDAVMSCLVPAAQAQHATVVTIEGLADDDSVHPMQQAFVDKFAVQCGYCIPGFVMAAQTLAQELDSPPTRDELELALSGNLCRCTGYYNIIDAVQTALQGPS